MFAADQGSTLKKHHWDRLFFSCDRNGSHQINPALLTLQALGNTLGLYIKEEKVMKHLTFSIFAGLCFLALDFSLAEPAQFQNGGRIVGLAFYGL